MEKYYILDNDWNYECLEKEIIPDEYLDNPLYLGMQLQKMPPIKFVISSNCELPNSIPNHHQILCFDNNVRQIIERQNDGNLQWLDVIVCDKNDKIISFDYKALNILTLIDAIDLEKSKLLFDEEDIVDILDLRLDYSNVNNEGVFRLKSCKTLAFFRGDIAEEIVESKYTGLNFFHAEGYHI